MGGTLPREKALGCPQILCKLCGVKKLRVWPWEDDEYKLCKHCSHKINNPKDKQKQGRKNTLAEES